jgi:hypothetical protein
MGEKVPGIWLFGCSRTKAGTDGKRHATLQKPARGEARVNATASNGKGHPNMFCVCPGLGAVSTQGEPWTCQLHNNPQTRGG